MEQDTIENISYKKKKYFKKKKTYIFLTSVDATVFLILVLPSKT